jgi:hypothetical protein
MTSNFEKMKELISKEKRLCDRLDLPLTIRYSLVNANGVSGQWSEPVFLDNIGGDGLGFSDDMVLSKGDRLEIELHLPVDKKPFFLGAEVVWVQKNFVAHGEISCGKFSYGLRIFQLDDDARKKFEQFISDSIIDKYLNDDGKLKDIEN